MAPPTGSQVQRSRLLKKIDQGLTSKFIMVNAPAGSGKSTLLDQWCIHTSHRTCWFSVTPSDDDAMRFWNGVIISISHGARAIGESLLPRITGPQPLPVEQLIAGLVAMLDQLDRMFVLILDDFHLIESQAVQTQVFDLIAKTPSSLRLILATRIAPGFVSPRLRLAGDVAEISAEDLKFNASEASQLLDPSLSQTQTQALLDLTEGWVAGLKMVTLAGKDPNQLHEPGMQRQQLSEYLYQEIFNQLPKGLQAFLLKTSIVSQFDASLCKALTHGPNCADTLREIKARNLFLVTLNPEGNLFRYHHLFSDFLLATMRRNHPEWEANLHSQAASWFREQGLCELAYQHAVAAKAYEDAAEDFEQLAYECIRICNFPSLLRWAKDLPESIIRERSELCLALATAHLMIYQWHPFERRMAQLDNLIELGQACDRTKAGASVLRASIARQMGQLDQACDHCQEALLFLDKSQSRARSETLIILGACFFFKGQFDAAQQTLTECLTCCQMDDATEMVYLGARALLGDLALIHGQFQQASRLLRASVNEIQGDPRRLELPMAAMVYVGHGEVLYERNQLAEARQALEKAKNLAQAGQLTGPEMRILLAQIRVFHALGDHASTEQCLNQALHLNQSTNIQTWQQNLLYAAATELRYQQNQVSAAGDFYQRIHFNPADEVTFTHPDLEYCRFLHTFKTTDHGPDLNTVANALAMLRASGRLPCWLRLQILKANCLQRDGQLADAFAVLEEALSLAEPEGALRVFAEPGLDTVTLLSQLFAFNARRTQTKTFAYSNGFLNSVLKLFPHQNTPATLEHQLPHPLTRRESEVLALIATGVSNGEIANKLNVSMATLKTHINKIYAKLKIKGRTQAVLTAQKMGLC